MGAGAWGDGEGPLPSGELGQRVVEADALFHESMDDDFNSAKAIGHLFDLSRHVNRTFDEGIEGEARAGARALLGLGQVLGLFWKAPGAEDWEAGVLALAQERDGARKARDWKKADALRKQLLDLGVLVEDAADGFRLKRR